MMATTSKQDTPPSSPPLVTNGVEASPLQSNTVRQYLIIMKPLLLLFRLMVPLLLMMRFVREQSLQFHELILTQD